MFRLFLVVPLTIQWWLQAMTRLRKKYHCHRGYWKFRKDGTGQFMYFFKGKDPGFLTNHYLLHFWNPYSLATSLWRLILKLHWKWDEIIKLVSSLLSGEIEHVYASLGELRRFEHNLKLRVKARVKYGVIRKSCQQNLPLRSWNTSKD